MFLIMFANLLVVTLSNGKDAMKMKQSTLLILTEHEIIHKLVLIFSDVMSSKSNSVIS